MDIYDYYMRHTINGAPRSVITAVLQNNDPLLHAKVANGRILVSADCTEGERKLQKLFKSRIIKCVKDYYQKPDEPFTFKSNNAFLLCDRVRDHYNIDGYVSRNDCRSCHLCAMQKANEGNIEYK